jgi:hypothetical protein
MTAALVILSLVCLALIFREFFPGYLREKGKNLATKEDFQEIVRQLHATTTLAEQIKAQIAGGLWVEQSRWTFKAEFYKELLESTGILASSLRQLAAVEQQRHLISLDPTRTQRLDDIERDYDGQAVSAFSRLVKCEAVARAWLSPEALNALDAFSHDWSEAWIGPTTIEDRTQRCHDAGISLHALLCRAVRDDLQLRSTV